MEKTVKLIAVCLVFAILAVFFASCDESAKENPSESGTDSESAKENSSESENDAVSEHSALDFTVTDGNGNEVKLSDFFGKPIVLNFWASWCPPCKAEMPDFNEAYKNNPDVRFMMVNLTDGQTETVATAKAFIESQGYEFPVYFDTKGIAANTYGITSIPATFFIDKNGDLITYSVGMLDAERLAAGIEMIK